VSDIKIAERKGELKVREGKGSKAREIPLDNKTRGALAVYLSEWREDGTGWLFCVSLGFSQDRSPKA